MRIVLLLYASMLFTHCRPAQDTESRIYNNDYADQQIFMAIGNEKDGQFDLYFSTMIEASEFSVCIKERNQTDDGVCIPNEKSGKYFKAVSKLSHQLQFKVTVTDSNGKEYKQLLETREFGQLVQPNPIASDLPTSMNFELTDASGNKTKVADVFKKKYMLVEFSAYDCGPCRSFAQNFNRNAAKYESYFEKGQCSKLVIVDDYGGLRGNFPSWISMLGGANSYLGKASYKSGLGIREAANRLNFRQQFGIPTLILIDRTGKIIDYANGMPSKLEQLCKQ